MSHKLPRVSNKELQVPGAAGVIALDTPAWFAWLEDDAHHSFHFSHRCGEFTARKERKQRGHWYWVAYRQAHCKLHKHYLGKSEALTEAQLCSAAQSLARAIDPAGEST